MKAISLWQPWASAVALGHKKNETRGWATKYRGELAIHAAKRFGRDEGIFLGELIAAGIKLPTALPLGCIVAVVRLVDVHPAEAVLPTIGAAERMLGNYAPGRFAWLFADIKPLPEPVPFKGAQGFFHVPDELLA